MSKFAAIALGWFVIFLGLSVIVVVAEQIRHRRKIARADERFDSIARGLAAEESKDGAERDEDAA